MKIQLTGYGVVTGIGLNAEENLNAIRRNENGMGKVTLFPTKLNVPVCEVKRTNEQLKQLLSLPASETFSRTSLLGMLAAREALLDAHIDPAKQRTGFISATSVGGMDLSEGFYEEYKKDHSHGRLREIAHHDCGDSTEAIARYLNITDFVTTISTACSSAANAIMLGARMLRNNLLDVVVVGGVDSLCKFTMNGFNSLMILDSEHCRPFDNTRAGLNLGEGAGYVVLQREDILTKTPYCELKGFANANDAYHQTATSPDGDGPYLSMSKALEKAGIDLSKVDYINAHGTGTGNNDLSEGRAIKRLFGDNIPKFSSTKVYTGHTLGAAGGIEAVYSVMSIVHDVIYPTFNFKTPIEDLDIVPETKLIENAGVKTVLSNSFGFGGNVSSLLFSSPNP